MLVKLFAAGISFYLVFFGMDLYQRDNQSIKQAHTLNQIIIDYCLKHQSYPPESFLNAMLPSLKKSEWGYFPSEDLKTAAIQYPMTLPLPAAPGEPIAKDKLSFLVDGYEIENPCGDFERAIK